MISHQHKLLFYHIPRTAGTTLELLFINMDWAYVDLSTKHPSMENFKKIYEEFWMDYQKISIVRNPFSWVKSTYTDKTSPNQNFEDYCLNFNLDYGVNDSGIKYCDIKGSTFTEILGNNMDEIYHFEFITGNKFSTIKKEYNLSKHTPKSMVYENHNKTLKPLHTSKTIEIIRHKFKDDFINFYPNFLNYDNNTLINMFN